MLRHNGDLINNSKLVVKSNSALFFFFNNHEISHFQYKYMPGVTPLRSWLDSEPIKANHVYLQNL